MIIESSVPARMGLMGNPSDGFGGKTLAAQIEEFAATITLWESPDLIIKPHPHHDPSVFESLPHLHKTAQQDGYYGGMRLLYATCKHFYEYCCENDIPLRDANFTLEYDTIIPRQVGLGGSSAIVVATLKALMEFYGVSEEQISRPILPQLALDVEQEELDITAGLQDRVSQVYGGLVYMDFNPRYMDTHGHGYYTKMDPELLPQLYLAYLPHSTQTSGKAHNRIRYRYENGNEEVQEAMKTFARFAEEGRELLKRNDIEAFADLMDENFDLRRDIYGEDVLGAKNIEMVEIARSFGLPAKFTGSGGAITGVLWPQTDVSKVQGEFDDHGYIFQQVTPCDPTQ